MEEQWEDPEAVVMECDSCGDVRPCVYGTDPFTAEVYPEDVEDSHTKWWCYPCWDARKMDI